MSEAIAKPAAESFPQLEEQVLSFWARSDTFNQTLAKPAPRGDYVFYDGPPFATGTPHYGHIVASIMKDIIPRYQTMRGYHVDRKWGWDCHGLPIENIVEKELGTKTKKDIIDLGVAKFNDLCRSRVLTYVDEWRRVIRRLGRWADMDQAYKTMDLDFMDSIWWAFKRLWEEGLIYQDYRSMHICPRCETTLSQSEVTEGYRDIKDLSATAKFELIGEPGTYVLAWTTTPWTLIGNVALAVGSEIKYVKVESGGDKFILAADRLADVFRDRGDYKVLQRYEGNDLAGQAYRPLFDYYAADPSLPQRENGWKIYSADFVTTTEGTGVVHIAPAFGEDDMNLGKANNLPFIQHVGMDGIFKPAVKDFSGRHVKPIEDHTATDVEIIKYLAAHGTLFSKEKYEHSYPHCWRCDTPLINYATSSWFVGVTKIKDKLLANAKGINWSPDHIKDGRFGNWLEGARDWSISRQRFWASAIPIWECACGERRVVGSVAELAAATGREITDIHKDKVDPLTFPCPKCGAEMKRISDVIDCWFESGSMPFAQLHYPADNKDKFEANFPAQFIAEGVDQTRAWFYYLHVIAGGIFKKNAYQNVIVNGIVLAEDGKKMSKRLNNYPDPMLVMEKYGADALRAYLAAAPVMAAENLNFSEKGVQESLRKNIMLLWNVYKFYEMFRGEAASAGKRVKPSEHILDKWIMAKLQILTAEVTASLEAYNLPKAVRPLTDFIDELSTWYLRRSRDRFKSDDLEDKQSALATTRYVLIELSKLLAPFMPFMAENLWQRVSGNNFQDLKRSVHLEAWPDASGRLSGWKKRIYRFLPGHKTEAVLADMALVRRIVELGLAQRDAAGIKIRQMLSGLKVKTAKLQVLGEEYVQLIKDEVNVQYVSFESAAEGQADRLAVELDAVLTPELKREGSKREIIRFINLLRKDAGLSLADRTIVCIAGASEEIKEDLLAKAAEIKKDTLSDDLIFTAALPAVLASREVKIDDQILILGLSK
ncbi:MAG: isoleucine--tRNA ligase [Patescibacteria group bacterium]